PPEAPAALVATQRALLLAQVDEQLSRLAAIDAEIAKRQAERRTVESGMKRLERALPLLRERADARNELAREGYGSRLLALEVSQQQIEMEQELQTMRHRREESAAALVALDRQRAQAGSEYLKQTFTALAEAERRVAATQEELAKAQQRQDLRNLTAPIDGVVQQLAVNTVGGVVTPAQALMVVVPAEADIEVEATLRNRDVGFVVPGQPVEVKLEAFQFTKYGGVPGRVVTVSRDAVPDERRGLVYPVRIALDRGTIDVDGRPQALTPGMALTAEIKTGDRRIIDYLMSPIVRYRDEAMRER
ncbi:MAG: HlyD family type I secretion periplasmic adaptor subunit, partial [Ferrovibrionaceae bacterium]